MKREIMLITLIFLSAGSILATSFSGPVKQAVYSSNGKFMAVIDPEKSVQNIYRTSEPGRLYWSFSFLPEMDSWFVADNGGHVVCIRWRFVRSEDLARPAIIIFKKDGNRSEYSYNSLVKARRPGILETAPRGGSWRIWYESLSTKNNRVEITTHQETRIVIYGDSCKLDIYRD